MRGSPHGVDEQDEQISPPDQVAGAINIQEPVNPQVQPWIEEHAQVVPPTAEPP